MAVQYGHIINQYISFGTPAAIQNLATKTICAWLNMSTASDGWMFVLKNSAATDEGFQFYIRSDGAPHYRLAFLTHWSTSDGFWGANHDIGTGLHHLAVTYNNSATANDPVFYIDGVTYSNVVDTNPVGTYRSGTTNTAYVGSDNAGIIPSPNGNLQDLRIYNRILTASEIAALAGSSRTLEMNDNGLVFHAPLMYAANRYPTVPFAGTLGVTDYTYDRINSAQGVPSGSPTGAADMVYGSSF